MISIIAIRESEARREAERRLGGKVHIKLISYVYGRSEYRRFTYQSSLSRC